MLFTLLEAVHAQNLMVKKYSFQNVNIVTNGQSGLNEFSTFIWLIHLPKVTLS